MFVTGAECLFLWTLEPPPAAELHPNCYVETSSPVWLDIPVIVVFVALISSSWFTSTCLAVRVSVKSINPPHVSSEPHGSSIAIIHFPAQKNIDLYICWQVWWRKAERCWRLHSENTPPRCFQLFSTSTSANGRRWCRGEGSLWETETASPFSIFHPRHLKTFPFVPHLLFCWHASHRLPGHVRRAQSGLITLCACSASSCSRCSCVRTGRKRRWDEYQPGLKFMIKRTDSWCWITFRSSNETFVINQNLLSHVRIVS